MTREPTEMELRVAEAIFDSWPHLTVGIARKKWDDIGPNNRDATWLPLARAAIRAMRISTLSMSEAGDKLIDKAYKNGAYEDSEYVWTAMINAALGDE